MKILFNRKPVEGPWGGGNNFVKSAFNILPSLGYKIIDFSLTELPDKIFLQSPFPDNEIKFSINEAIHLKQRYPNIEIIMRVNDCDARKNTDNVDKVWIESSKFVDKTVFVSNWMKEYFINKGWKCNKNYVLYNGVDLDHFKVRNKIQNGKVNIVTHHWSNNKLKGFDIYDQIDQFVGRNKKFTFTYIGRDRGTFKNTKIISPLFGKDLGLELSKYDIYVSASRFDPGPNHILESLACNIPTYVYKDGGGCVEFAGKNHIYENFEQLIDFLNKKEGKINNTINIDPWELCIKKLDLIIKEKGLKNNE
jgi:hypothetical protein